MPTFSPQTFGKYFLVDKIATGGMAEIFKAKTYSHGGFESLLVIKRILPHVGANAEFVEMFIDEAKVSVALQHPNIVRVFDFGQNLDDYFIAMECVDGKDARAVLQKLVKEEGCALEPAFAAYVAHETCKGLHYAHTKTDPSGRPYGIVHRDISPSNVLIGYEAQVKIADFGIAKAESNAYQTRDGVLKGKFEYMSPEQAEGHPLDARSDIFATGILLWEMLTGHRLFKADSDIAALRAVQAADVPPPRTLDPNIPEVLEQITLRALARDPDDRFQDAAAMAEALRTALLPDTPDGVRKRFEVWLHQFFAGEIAEERARLVANSAVAQELRRRPADWDGQTTSMNPDPVRAPGPRIWPVLALLGAVLAGTVGLAVVGMVVAVGWQLEDATSIGDVDVVVEPAARVYVDDVLRGTGATVVVSKLPAGEHTVRLEADGYRAETFRIDVPSGDALRIEKVLEPRADTTPEPEEPAPTTVELSSPVPAKPRPKPARDPAPVAREGAMRVESSPAGATVYLDGASVGTTPWTGGAPSGSEHTVRLEKPGHTSVSGTITVGDPASTVTFVRELPPADQPGSLAVLLVGGGWANVYVDGEKISKTAPVRGLELAVGTHEVRVENEGLGIDHTETVTVTSGASVVVRAAPR